MGALAGWRKYDDGDEHSSCGLLTGFPKGYQVTTSGRVVRFPAVDFFQPPFFPEDRIMHRPYIRHTNFLIPSLVKLAEFCNDRLQRSGAEWMKHVKNRTLRIVKVFDRGVDNFDGGFPAAQLL